MNMEKIREREFPVTQNRIFLDHAKVAPLSRRVLEATRSFAEDAANFGTANYARWMSGAEETRESFARLINAGIDEVAFVKNTTEGLSIVANGVAWRRGDNVVVPDIEFPSNVYPWLNLERLGVETRFVHAVDGRVEFDDIARRVDKRTRVVSVSSVECNSGFRNDLGRIGAFCKERGVYFCVDAIQSLGALPMDVKKWNVDFLSADGHKWMMSVEGLGGFYISPEVLEEVHPAVVGWDSVVDAYNFMNYDFTLRPGAKRFEEGSFNTMSIHALGAALSLLHEVGIERIETRLLELGDRILEALRARNLRLLSSAAPGERSGIISFTFDADLKKFSAFMAENRVSLTVRDGMVRLSPHFYNTAEEIDAFFDLLDRFRRLK
ncbi:MAG: aminotransferase class V-fold PLP-dependent enzyme [Nitrospinae bacterium]|nr:aminotransferase class V-fold PLP-dependent enzyme [Nitrospinota bacterium]